MDTIKATSVMITWQPPHDVEGIISGYQVSYMPHGESDFFHDITGNITITELTRLRPHTEYTIRVRAKSSKKYGEYSTPITAFSLEDGEWNIFLEYISWLTFMIMYNNID